MMKLNEAAALLGQQLLSSGLRLATAESCTAGLISMTLAAVENSGDFFTSGFVTYSESAKVRLLGVSEDTLEKHTAVSRETVCEMARGARERSGELVSLAISGYAGPDGGQDGTPAGTIWVGWALPGGDVIARCQHFSGEPKAVMEQGTIWAIQGLSELLTRPPSSLQTVKEH
ncbi:CinA family protein [Pantoea allii]|uniref:CinA family protein n=1 Tax=Pantoea allii TaxID=574096 RepID=UPI001F4D8749|nr:CinA family protein [Pantoea allii]MCH9299675.1 CinA family protein [Pantoea allii]